ncbi:MAG: hypothetical protein C5B50_18710 [Verrucomicrobia bacterium]|nr:MAG: hypothetical protein C5B50_18710 [Verrucomicrobiota bacterium]
MFEFLRKLWDLARPYRNRLLAGIALGVIGGLFEPLVISTVVFVYGAVFPSAGQSPSALVSGAPSWLRDWLVSAQQAVVQGVALHKGAAALLVGLVPLVVILRGVFTYFNVYLLQWAAIRTITSLRIRLFAHLMSLSANFFNGVRTGELMSRVMSDTTALQNIISNATPVMVKDPVTLVSLLAYVLWRAPRLTLLSLAVIPICVVPVLVYNRKVRRSARELQAQAANLGDVMAEAFSGYRVVKAYNLEQKVVERFRLIASRFIGHYMRMLRSMEIPGPLLESVGAIGVGLVLLYLLVESGARPTGSDFLAIVLSIFAMYRPLKNLARLYNTLEQARAASARVFELLSAVNDIQEPVEPKPLRAGGAAIEFDGVSFSYDGTPVLQDITLTIQPGQFIALVGASGAGKTTLANLLLRFYDPQHGAVRIGGTDIRAVATRELREQIAAVTQETIIFNETLQDNIQLGRPGAPKEDIIAAARHAYAYDFILKTPEGFGTPAGEKGVLLSGGQRQRIAIARAILRNAPILILDEATSALDSESERAVQAALDQLTRGRTTICIAHRLSTIQKADLIVVLDQGRVVETGTHAALMDRKGVYYKLYALQFAQAGNGSQELERM